MHMVLFSDQGNQGVPDNDPTGTTGTKEKGVGRQRLTHYTIMILKGIQAAGKETRQVK